jgi:hypothetical protein
VLLFLLPTSPSSQSPGAVSRCPKLGCRARREKTIQDNRRRCFPRGPPRGYITTIFKGAISCFQVREFIEVEFIGVSCCRELDGVVEMAVEEKSECVKKRFHV